MYKKQKIFSLWRLGKGLTFELEFGIITYQLRKGENKMDYMELSPVPSDEPCIQVGSEEYFNGKDRIECRIFKKQLERMFPITEDIDAYFSIRTNPHDFGSYREVAIYFNENDEIACEFAYNVEANLPERWDEIAIEELKKEGIYKG